MRSKLVILIFIVMLSCRKDDAETVFALPAETQTGANTFGFLLDDEVWINHGEICSLVIGGCRKNLTGDYFTSYGGISIQADRVLYSDGIANNESIRIDLHTGFDGLRTYSTLADDYMEVFYSPSDNQPGYRLDDINPRFTINLIRLDTVDGVISGEFFGTLFRETSLATSPSDSVRLTEGRFDLKYK
jgi:hypothetical protein